MVKLYDKRKVEEDKTLTEATKHNIEVKGRKYRKYN